MLDMTETERMKWVERCNAYQEEANESTRKAGGGRHVPRFSGSKRARRR